MDWLTDNKLPIGAWIRALVDLINQHAAGFLNGISWVVGGTIEALIEALQAIPPVLLALIFAGAVWLLRRSWKLTLLVLLAGLLVINLGYWDETIETLALVTFATVICMAVGVPIGIAAAHRPRLYAALRPVLDLMQTIPTFVYLIPTLILFGLGIVPGIISTVVFALPTPIRLTQLGIASVPPTLLEAGQAFGATRRQLLLKIELPHAMPTIMTGLTQCIMLSLSMVVIAALVGADGLGKPVVRALNTVNIGMGFEAGLAIVLLAIALDRICRVPAQQTGR